MQSLAWALFVRVTENWLSRRKSRRKEGGGVDYAVSNHCNTGPFAQQYVLRLKIFIVEKIIQIIGMYMVTRV